MTLAKLIYRSCRHTGLRALANRLSAKLLPLPSGAEKWQGSTLRIPGLGAVNIALYPRRSPPQQPKARRFFMLSLRMTQPMIPAWHYAWLLRTSHFGCGHFELACYEEQGSWTVHGIRNMTTASCAVGNPAILRSVLRSPMAFGLAMRLAPTEECVQLSINPALLPAKHRLQRMQALQQSYEDLHEELASQPADSEHR